MRKYIYPAGFCRGCPERPSCGRNILALNMFVPMLYLTLCNHTYIYICIITISILRVVRRPSSSVVAVRRRCPSSVVRRRPSSSLVVRRRRPSSSSVVVVCHWLFVSPDVTKCSFSAQKAKGWSHWQMLTISKMLGGQFGSFLTMFENCVFLDKFLRNWKGSLKHHHKELYPQISKIEIPRLLFRYRLTNSFLRIFVRYCL